MKWYLADELERVDDDEISRILESIRHEVRAANLISDNMDCVLAAHKQIASNSATIQRVLGGSTLLSSSVNIIGSVVLGENIIIGPNAMLGPNTYIKKCTVCFPGVTLGYNVEVNSSVLFDCAKIAHTSFIGSSIVGEGSNLGIGAVTTTRRLDRSPVSVKDKCGRSHILDNGLYRGTVFGARCQIGANVTFMPGATVLPGRVVKPNSQVRGMVF